VPISSEIFIFDQFTKSYRTTPNSHPSALGGYRWPSDLGEGFYYRIQNEVHKINKEREPKLIDLLLDGDFYNIYPWNNEQYELERLEELLQTVEQEYNEGKIQLEVKPKVQRQINKPRITNDGKIELDPERHIKVIREPNETYAYDWDSLVNVGDHFIIKGKTLPRVSANANYQMKRTPNKLIKCHATPDGIFVVLAYNSSK